MRRELERIRDILEGSEALRVTIVLRELATRKKRLLMNFRIFQQPVQSILTYNTWLFGKFVQKLDVLKAHAQWQRVGSDDFHERWRYALQIEDTASFLLSGYIEDAIDIFEHHAEDPETMIECANLALEKWLSDDATGCV